MGNRSRMRISVIVPLYKGAKYVSNIVEMCSRAFIKANILQRAEIIFVNDYPDEKIVFSDDLEYVFLINNSKNQGIHQSRINGLHVANGEFIHFLDQDDVINEDFYINLLMKDKNADVIIGNGNVELNDGRLKRIYSTRLERNSVKFISWYIVFDNRIISPGQCLVRTESISEQWINNVMSTNCADDMLLWLLLLLEKKRFYVVNLDVYIHNYTGVNQSLDKDNMAKSLKEMYEILISHYKGGVMLLLKEKVLYLNGKNEGMGVIFRLLFLLRRLRLIIKTCMTVR